MKMYKVNRYRRYYSIDEVTEDGRYLCQVAYYFRSRRDAERRMQQLIAEDAAEIPMSIVSDGQCVPNHERKTYADLGITPSAAWKR